MSDDEQAQFITVEELRRYSTQGALCELLCPYLNPPEKAGFTRPLHVYGDSVAFPLRHGEIETVPITGSEEPTIRFGCLGLPNSCAKQNYFAGDRVHKVSIPDTEYCDERSRLDGQMARLTAGGQRNLTVIEERKTRTAAERTQSMLKSPE